MLRCESLTWRRVELPTTEASCDGRRRWRFPAKRTAPRNLELSPRIYCDNDSSHQNLSAKLKMMVKRRDRVSGGGLQGGEVLLKMTG